MCSEEAATDAASQHSWPNVCTTRISETQGPLQKLGLYITVALHKYDLAVGQMPFYLHCMLHIQLSKIAFQSSPVQSHTHGTVCSDALACSAGSHALTLWGRCQAGAGMGAVCQHGTAWRTQGHHSQLAIRMSQ